MLADSKKKSSEMIDGKSKIGAQRASQPLKPATKDVIVKKNDVQKSKQQMIKTSHNSQTHRILRKQNQPSSSSNKDDGPLSKKGSGKTISRQLISPKSVSTFRSPKSPISSLKSNKSILKQQQVFNDIGLKYDLENKLMNEEYSLSEKRKKRLENYKKRRLSQIDDAQIEKYIEEE